MTNEELKNEDVKIYEINKTELNKEENNSKVKPIVRCIFCEKLENQFRRCEKSNSKINDENENNKRKKIKKKSSKIFSKEESVNGINMDTNNGVEEGGEDFENEKEKKENKNNVSTENNLPTMITNVNKSFDTYYKNFNGCKHYMCYNCIARILFTSHLNEIPLEDNIKFTCKCNKGNLELSTNDLLHITNKLKLPVEEKLCDKHGLVLVKFCLECKKILCKKCLESHADLFGENLHHLDSEIPEYSDVCKDHPSGFLDTLCTDCHMTICHYCLLEGNKHDFI